MVATISRTQPSFVRFDLGEVAGVWLRGQLLLVDVPSIPLRRPLSDASDRHRAEQECVAWATAIGLANPSNAYFAKFCQSRLAELSAYTLPDVPVERAAWFLHLQAFIFTLDDALDNLIDLRGGEHLRYEQVRVLFNRFERALAGDPRSLDEPAAFEFPLGESFIRAMWSVGLDARDTGLDTTWFLASMSAYFDALAWEHSARADGQYRPSLSTYAQNREQTISYLQSLESFFLIKRVEIPRVLRQRHAAALLFSHACRHVILVNDMFSLAKELACDELENVLLLDAEAPLLVQFERLLRETNALAADLVYNVRRVEQDFPPNSPGLRALLETVIQSVNGHVAWYAKSRRYGNMIQAPRIDAMEDLDPTLTT
jgi:hypothetical protein